MSECCKPKRRNTWPFWGLTLTLAVSVCWFFFWLVDKAILNERRQEREYHRASRWETAVDALGNGVLLADEHGIIFDTNQSLTNMLGWTAEELAGQPIDIIMPPDERAYHKKGFEDLKAREFIAQGGTLIIDGCSVRKKNGGTMKVRTRIQSSRGLDESEIFVSTITPWGQVKIVEYGKPRP